MQSEEEEEERAGPAQALFKHTKRGFSSQSKGLKKRPLTVLPPGGAHTSSPACFLLAGKLEHVVQVQLSQSEAAVCAKLPASELLCWLEMLFFCLFGSAADVQNVGWKEVCRMNSDKNLPLHHFI